ncbi:carotenoid oxygenase family protein [Sporosarcina sp. GW1-11]|uniref:carotenoid oxygenase family protein n=1 Tax=Sporosarcina sp. GW1-11 TaxID=2899126 RepID=UPI00294C1369|nr:carotenoid oxygenase family protein [Sporosarcina sp. GW1-11]MDV6378722.1 carotenoid oxygenase family protein [Sporosarcina sp. GW1-11]
MIKVENEVKLTIAEDETNPFLLGHFESVSKEYTATTESLEVIGEIPKDLNGVYVRNGHNQVHAPMGVYHPFDGDGMLHAVHFEDGKATYRNRFVRTTGFLAEEAAGKSLWSGILEPHLTTRQGWGSMGTMKDNAGTDVIAHGGKLLASMSQCSEINRMDPVTLEMLEPDSWNTTLAPQGICSHFKVDNDTGELMFFNFSETYPYMNYGVVGPDSELKHYVPIDLPGVRWPHDLGVTKNYSILHDLPFIFDPKLLEKGQRKVTFFDDMPARFGIIPRHGTNEDVKWFEAKSCFILHLSNCYEDGDNVIMEGCVTFNPGKPEVGKQASNATDKIKEAMNKTATQYRMYRWTFNLKTGKTKEEFLDEEATEFPVVSNDYVGKKYRYSYNSTLNSDIDKPWYLTGLIKYDLQEGTSQKYEYGEGRLGSEPHIARRKNAVAEDDGYLITLVTDLNENRSECLILDASDFSKGPVARIMLPHRIPTGAHGAWVEEARIKGELVK